MRIFISYSHEDKVIVNELIELVQVGGHQTAYDRHELIPGRVWKEQLRDEIEQCDAVIAVLSPKAATSEWCKWEVDQAIELRKPIVPVLVCVDTPIPEALKELQYVDFSISISALETTRLMRSLQNLSAASSPKTQYASEHALPTMPFDVKEYLSILEKTFQNAKISDWYVAQSGYIQSDQGVRQLVSVDDYVERWLQNKSKQHLAILGDYGSGKSWFCLRLAKKLAAHYRIQPNSNPLPLLITFRQYMPKMDLIALIEAELFNGYGLKLDNPLALKMMLKSGKIFLLLDGMDEMAKDLGNHTALVAYTRLGIALEIPKVIVTCRTHYFYSGSEEREILNPDAKNSPLNDSPQFDVLHLKLFDSAEIDLCIHRRFKSQKSAQVFDFIRLNYNLLELCSRPVLLALVCDSHDLLMELHNPVSSVDLYEAYTGAWLRRELKEGRLFLDPNAVYEFFEDLSQRMVQNNTLVIKADDLRKEFATFLNRLGLPQEQWREIERQLVTSAFVRRTIGDGWEFAHRSFQEFFYARKFFRWEDQTEGEGHYAVIHIPIWQFIASMALNRWTEQKALHWIKPLVDRRNDPTLTLTTLRAAAAFWLLKKGSLPSREYSLIGIMLDAVDLHGLDLSRCDLTLADFHNSDLALTNLTGAILRDSILSGTNFEQAILDEASLHEANCRSASFKGASLQNTDLTQAALDNVSFVNANLKGAKLDRATVYYADFRGADFGIPGTQEYEDTMKGLRQSYGFKAARLV